MRALFWVVNAVGWSRSAAIAGLPGSTLVPLHSSPGRDREGGQRYDGIGAGWKN
jgi:hypothetical protein